MFRLGRDGVPEGGRPPSSLTMDTVRVPPTSLSFQRPKRRRRRVTKVAPVVSIRRMKSSILFNMRRIPAKGVGRIQSDPFQAFSFHDPSTIAVMHCRRANAGFNTPTRPLHQGLQHTTCPRHRIPLGHPIPPDPLALLPLAFTESPVPYARPSVASLLVLHTFGLAPGLSYRP